MCETTTITYKVRCVTDNVTGYKIPADYYYNFLVQLTTSRIGNHTLLMPNNMLNESVMTTRIRLGIVRRVIWGNQPSNNRVEEVDGVELNIRKRKRRECM